MCNPTNNNNRVEGKPTKLVGSIPELGDAVFTLGEKNSLANFDSVRRRIANHAGTNLDSSMCDLMLYDMEQTFTKPTRPTSKAVLSICPLVRSSTSAPRCRAFSPTAT